MEMMRNARGHEKWQLQTQPASVVMVVLLFSTFATAQDNAMATANLSTVWLNFVNAGNQILSDGDNVTCIPIEQQLSLQSPVSSLQRSPSFALSFEQFGGQRTNQTFKQEFGECPQGTIPVRQSRARVSSSNSDSHSPRLFKKMSRTASQQDNVVHEYAYSLITRNQTGTAFKGTHAIFNLWKPFVENANEFSLAQLWITGGHQNTTNATELTSTIEVGYQIFEGLYGDTQPRLFVYWTKDNYNQTGCYNLEDCAGFVQVSNKVLLGGSFASPSKMDSTQYEIEITVLRDEGSENWWLFLEDEAVGYWPGALYYSEQLKNAGRILEFGGEIIDDETKDGGRHTKTEMGSGQFPSDSTNYQRVAYQRNILYANDNNKFQPVPLITGNPKAPLCYNSTIGIPSPTFSNWGSYFFFGGSGFSKACAHDPRFNNTSS